MWLPAEEHANFNLTMPDSQDPPSDRREPRIPIELRVEYRRLNSFFADYTKNISKGGTFIRTAKPLPPGTEFVFVLIIPKLPEPLRLNGEVVWTVEPTRASDDNPPGMGIRFKYLDDAEREATEEIVGKLVKSELGDHISERLLRAERSTGEKT
jgi:type IV pilus assembly protein PilZ